ncbi:MAG: UDP-3-O-(3-hydroxymyristoyl)glucosamine N-acyltransferase [Helicobacter sp.]|nr:UDP-3-O-(3-hydroxymyristoyl)glucosamine N-acyltransferase [Helicobacter sp.]
MRLTKLLEQINITAKSPKDFEVNSLAPIDKAGQNDICYVDKPKYLKDLQNSKAGAVFIREGDISSVPESMFAIIVDNPHLYFAKASAFFRKPQFLDCEHKIHKSLILGQNVTIGKNASIHPNVVIMDNVSIGDNAVIYPNVVIYANTIIGDNVIIHAGCVIGSDGFGYAHTKSNEHVKIEHNGYVQIGSDVEIGANTTIDRGVFGATKIENGVKIDNLVQIGHNCVIGENSIIVAQVGLAGSTIVGKNVIFGGQAGTGGHITIGDNVLVAGKTGVGKNLPSNTKWGGHPMMELDEWMKFYVSLKRLLKAKS